MRAYVHFRLVLLLFFSLDTDAVAENDKSKNRGSTHNWTDKHSNKMSKFSGSRKQTNAKYQIDFCASTLLMRVHGIECRDVFT